MYLLANGLTFSDKCYSYFVASMKRRTCLKMLLEPVQAITRELDIALEYRNRLEVRGQIRWRSKDGMKDKPVVERFP